MKIILIITLLTVGINLNAQKVVSIEASGNLESPNPCGCIELAEVTNENNPADIMAGMEKCIDLKQYKKAARLFAIAGVYGKYDTYRVKDNSAHQALSVLNLNIFEKLDESTQKQLMKIFKHEFKTGSKELNNICQLIQKVGIPKYYPRYMIQHGIQSFMESEGKGLVEEFDSSVSWDLAMKEYLHCGK